MLLFAVLIPMEYKNMNNTITTRSIITEVTNLLTGEVEEVRRMGKTSITAIAKQLVGDNDGAALKLAASIRFRVNQGATILEAIKAATNSKGVNNV
jgi:hypothetical protein